jgi:formamidopyrimidine-DNA glycosylase
MPELPEVETNMRNLGAWTRGRTLVRVEPPPGTRETGGVPRRLFVRRLTGRTVLRVERRGKWILVALSGGAGLGLHLGMTGKLAMRPDPAAPAPRLTRATFHLDDRRRVFFVDSRRFGRLRPVSRYPELLAMPEVAGLGPDALTELDQASLAEALSRTARTVKETIMDQRVTAGVGNLYAAEALWHARIHPKTPARWVAARPAAVARLLDGIHSALRQGLETYGGTAEPEYIEEGAPNPFHVYDRGGRPCSRCGARVASVVLGGRTSFYCPRCQRLPRRRS